MQGHDDSRSLLALRALRCCVLRRQYTLDFTEYVTLRLVSPCRT